MGECRGVDDCVRRRQFVPGTEIGGRQRDGGVERNDNAGFGKGDYLIGPGLPALSAQPFRQFDLHDGRHEPLPAIR